MTRPPIQPGSLPPALAVSLSDYIAYVAGGVVSKTLLNKDAGTVTLFAFDAGQGLSEHTAPFSALVQIVDGTSRWSIGGATVEVAAGQLVLLPSGVPHSVQADQRFKMMLTMIREPQSASQS